MSSSELWTMSILQALHPHPPQLLLGEGAGLASLLLGSSFRGFPQVKCWEESWTVGLRVLGLTNADETSAHHRQPTGTSASRNPLCFVLETGWVCVILCPLIPLGDCLGGSPSQLLRIFYRFPAQMYLWPSFSSFVLEPEDSAGTNSSSPCLYSSMLI